MNISSLVWKYEIVSELCSGNDFGTDGWNDGMTDGRTTPKPISPFHFVAGDNNTKLLVQDFLHVVMKLWAPHFHLKKLSFPNHICLVFKLCRCLGVAV